MATKMKDTTGAGSASMVDAVAASAQQIWQAGLGAFAKAQHDGGALFDTLVRDGAELHTLTQEMDKDLGKDRGPGVSGKVGRLASGSWDRIEKIFEDRVARSLHSLGVPSREELDALRRDVEALKAAAVRKPASRQAKPAAKPTAKAAAKRAPNKAAAAPKRPARADGTRVRA